MVICLDKDTLSCVTCRRKIERAFLVIWIEWGFSGEFCDVGLSCIIYTRKSGLPVRDRIFENFWKSKYRPTFLIWFLGITHQRVSLEKLWAIRKNWSCPEILNGYRKSLLTVHPQCKILIKIRSYANTSRCVDRIWGVPSRESFALNKLHTYYTGLHNWLSIGDDKHVCVSC